ncbi:mitochondrial 3-hydroxyisobutyryl-CoA hydrolase domain protein [Andalucia godoyi]|uniref:3-hydroxyisobutyryl-CoA hydrolase n=1 Tax=Andalucia godoyi TaxID=505711 RepID=A0A8K0F0N6_ANDGO|nr:mitochondrial 3-hydroxyisobutyryl-CoA hydrolase domain protein [Andalucia godoyi]|eukprot:ANDGO_00091.mRNA.1 mitochondrial 3-hydroxyisobutyryl-CoA hydrolase domain protein
MFVRSVSSSFTTAAHEASVLLEKTATSRFLTLNRPKVLNALNLGMVRELQQAANSAENADSCYSVVLRGAGEKAFCAGGDIKAIALAARELQSGQKKTLPASGDENPLAFFREEYQLDYTLATLSKPVVAILDGITMGGGVGISVHGAFRIATDKTVFAMPETAIGFFPDVGGSFMLPRLPFHTGLWLALTGHRISGAETAALGIATHYVPSPRIPLLLDRLSLLSSSDYKTVALAIEEFAEPYERDVAKLSFAPFYEVIREAFSIKQESVAAIRESLKKFDHDHRHDANHAVRQFAAKTIAILDKVSPTSLEVTLEQVKRGAKLGLADCLKMELRIASHMMENPDFVEGVRALLIDKDNAPKWAGVPTNVKAFFEPIKDELVLDEKREAVIKRREQDLKALHTHH